MSHLGLTGDLVSEGFVNSPSSTLPPTAHKACLTGSGHRVLGGCPLSSHLQNPGVSTKNVPLLPLFRDLNLVRLHQKSARTPLISHLLRLRKQCQMSESSTLSSSASSFRCISSLHPIPFQCGSFYTNLVGILLKRFHLNDADLLSVTARFSAPAD